MLASVNIQLRAKLTLRNLISQIKCPAFLLTLFAKEMKQIFLRNKTGSVLALNSRGNRCVSPNIIYEVKL